MLTVRQCLHSCIDRQPGGRETEIREDSQKDDRNLAQAAREELDEVASVFGEEPAHDA